MIKASGIGIEDVRGVYSGPEGELWELIMGEQIHIGGFVSSMDLADRAGIEPGMQGVDLCCCNGAGMRFLLRFWDVARMTGVDTTERVLEQARERCGQAGFAKQTDFMQADACATGLPDASFGFAWGEDAWCYVEDKRALIEEAARLTKTGGVVAFTDWIEGAVALNDDEAERFLRFMKFPNIQDMRGYESLLNEAEFTVEVAEDTGRFAPYMDLYIDMVEKQLSTDVMRIVGFDMDATVALGSEMKFMRELAHGGKIAQGMFVGRKR